MIQRIPAIVATIIIVNLCLTLIATLQYRNGHWPSNQLALYQGVMTACLISVIFLIIYSFWMSVKRKR